MIVLKQDSGALIWEPLLSPEELRTFFQSRRRPASLYRRRNVSRPIVYRAIFPEHVDENGAHTPCYIGEGGDLRRLSNHFKSEVPDDVRDRAGNLDLPGGWWIRGAIQRSGGNFRLEILKIDGFINFGGIVLSQASLDDPFARRLLENWAILHARDVEKLRPYNRGISQSGKDLFRKLKASRESRSKSESLHTVIDVDSLPAAGTEDEERA